MQSSACADVNIWSRNEKERSCWRDGRGIGEIGEKMGEKVDEKMGEKMGGKMGEETCEGKRETAQVSSCRCGCECTVVTVSGPLA